MVLLRLFFLFSTSVAYSPLNGRLPTRQTGRKVHNSIGHTTSRHQRNARTASQRHSNSIRMGLLSWLDSKLDEQRRKRNFKRRPDRIILIRHGQSAGSMDRDAYATIPDSNISLTYSGWAQGAIAGAQLRKLIGNETVRFFHSPYLRAQQTLLAILKAFDGQTVEISTEPRLREVDFGNFQIPEEMENQKAEREKFGRFYYRFHNGESASDVFDRMASFLTYLFRTMQKGESGYFEGNDGLPAKNYVIISHGLLMRVFCMCYLRWTVREFEQVWNPNNGEIWVLEKIPGQGTYELAGTWRASPYGGNFTGLKFGKDQKEALHDHMKRPIVSRPFTPGAPDALKGIELANFHDLPGPVEAPSRSERSVAHVDDQRKHLVGMSDR